MSYIKRHLDKLVDGLRPTLAEAGGIADFLLAVSYLAGESSREVAEAIRGLAEDVRGERKE